MLPTVKRQQANQAIDHSSPKVSIGLPVYNGENYLREAITSLLGQTYTEFELIISDNASTDSTQAICEEFAAQDSRIRYYRADKNHGASWNHSFVITHAKAPLFKLAAHDDVCLPTHLERCVAALDANPTAQLAYTRTLMMHGDQSSMTFYQDDVELSSLNAAIRYGDLIHAAPPAFPIFGVVRTQALRSIPGFEPYKASDRVVLIRLALMHPFVFIDEPLFQYRWHATNASNLMASGNGFYTWWNPNAGQGRVFPECRIVYEHLRSVFLIPLSWSERRACLREWWHWVINNRQRIGLELKQLYSRAPLPPYPTLTLIDQAMVRRARAEFKARAYPNKSAHS
ncbi:glycosyl transferase [Arenicella chitinivorans]|uniref:Glycosyl transferase n=1 Tax=Arenicella chitinivorans TaxID=1329800 RepID=A0A918VSF2_9GAMM|nr:glycosyl transferase [Arenicella chitinivorans]